MSSVELPTVFPFQPVRMSVQRYHALVQVGAFTEHDRVELLNGIVTEQMSKNPPHSTATRKCDLRLTAMLSSDWHVQNQEPITLSTSEPEPDVTVVRGKLDDYSERHPGPEDVLLAVEVADTTLVTDRFKAEIYAAASIPVYWIVNLADRRLEVYSEPNLAANPSSYNKMVTLTRDDQVIDGKQVKLVPVRDLLP